MTKLSVNYFFYMLFFLLASPLNLLVGQENYCSEFNDGPNFAWQVENADRFFDATGGASGNPGDGFLRTDDDTNESWLYNDSQYAGDWLADYAGDCICWDFKIISDGGEGVNVAPSFSI